MIKQGLFVLLLLLSQNLLMAQSAVFVCDEDDNILRVNIAANNCSSQIVANTGTGLSDITLHPNGNMYGVKYSTNEVFRIDTTTGALTLLAVINEAANLVGMTADANGVIYITEGNTVPSRLFTFDVSNNTYLNKGWLAEGSAGDLTWYFGSLYNASDNNKLVKIDIDDPANSTVIGSFTGLAAGDRMFALVTAVASCDASFTYGLSEAGDIFTLDMATAVSTQICNGTKRIFGATSADEFNASQCFVFLDLDNNDNSGATGSDFNSDFICLPDKAALVADSDVSIEVANEMDSVTVKLFSGVLDGTNEFFEVRTTNNISSNNNAQSITGISNGNATTGNFEQFLNTMRYKNNALPASAGTRIIEVIGYSEGRSDTGYTTINLTDVYAGEDGSISFCSGDPSADLFNSLSNSPNVGGIWLPTLNSNTGVFDPDVDASGIYHYVVSDGCFIDSAQVNVMVASSTSFDLGNDTTICFASSFILNADIGNPSATYDWSTGSTNASITVTTAGNYSVTIDLGSCQVQDDISIDFVDFQLDLGNDIPICPGDSVLIGQNIGIAGATYIWSNGATTDQIYVSTPGSYTLSAEYQTCTVQDVINITTASTSNVPIDLGIDTSICDGTSIQLSSGYSTTAYDHVWSDGSTNSTLDVTTSGTYSVDISNTCQTGTDLINITVLPSVTLPVDLGADVTICDDENANFTVEPTYTAPTYNILWSNNASTSSINVNTAGNYSVTVSEVGICAVGSDDVLLIVENCDTTIVPTDTFDRCEIKMPTAFTPNNDNTNDVFGPVNICDGFTGFDLWIYNRYGEVVFQGSNTFWDGNYNGEAAPLDNFIWYALFYFETSETITQRGSIVLMR